MSTQAEAAAQLDAVTAQLVKVQDEIKALQAVVANSKDVDPVLQAAIDRVVVAAQGADDLNPDAAPAPAPAV